MSLLCAVAAMVLAWPAAAETPAEPPGPGGTPPPGGTPAPGETPAPVPTTETGTILLPAVAPEAPKRMHERFGEDANGLLGWVVRLAPGADGKTYTLERTTPLPGNPDVYFYEDDGGEPGDICSPVSRPDESGTYLSSETETGVICPGEQVGAWAMVVLFSGAGISFSLTY